MTPTIPVASDQVKEEADASGDGSLEVVLPDGRVYRGPRFDARWYAARYANRVACESDALPHYLSQGRLTGCKPNAAVLHNVTPRDPAAFTSEQFLSEIALIAESGVFDTAWYASRHAVPASGALPHYLVEGAYEGLDPNPFFSSRHYYDLHSDIGAAGVNPMWHYLASGCLEGRAGSIRPHLLGSLDFSETIWAKGLLAIDGDDWQSPEAID